MSIVIRIETDNANALYYVLRQIGYKAIYGGIQSIAGDYPGYVLAPNYTVGTVAFEEAGFKCECGGDHSKDDHFGCKGCPDCDEQEVTR